MNQTLIQSLKRTTLKTCSSWAEQYVMMGKPFPGPMSFKYHPWTKEMHDSRAPKNTGKKAAQVGYTVTMMNLAFYKIDQLGESVLYLLPSKTPDATDFSSTKFDPALEMSPHLADLFSDVKNAGTKRAGSCILYVRGANSRKGLKSISVGTVIMDEFDEMPEHTIPLAQERMSGQQDKQLWLISTPRFPGLGVDREFLDSTQEHFMFRCPGCSRIIEMKHENLVVTADDVHDPKINDSFVKCVECDKRLFGNELPMKDYCEMKADLLLDSQYVPLGHKDFDDRGFHVNQFYSPTIKPVTLASAWLKSLTNKSAEQEYHNSKMGDAHEVEGARISEEVFEECRTSRRKGTKGTTSQIVTMGVDVGRWLHYEIAVWDLPMKLGTDINLLAIPHIIDEGKKVEFEELDDLMRTWQILQAVVDVQPETKMAQRFANRFPGYVKLCRYVKGLTDNTIEISQSEKLVYNVNRTVWLDQSLGRFHQKRIDIPQDTSLEYKAHMKNIARIYEEDSDGNQIGRYISNGDDHFAHARNYNEIALPLAAAFKTNRDIKAFL